jgi:ribosome biogenesis GTPase
MKGFIITGINNIYTVETEQGFFECRLKGKVLKNAEDEYNPLAPGDLISFEPDAGHPGKGMITERLERKNAFKRWNKKRKAFQIIAANIDQLVCIASADAPPFRPRFIDRVLVQGEVEGFKPVIVINKWDLYSADEIIDERLALYEKLGYRVIRLSAKTGMNVDILEKELENRLTLFFGQSGAGKSSLINTLAPHLEIRTGEISFKHERGTHTTTFAFMHCLENGIRIIDTPGVRELELNSIDKRDLQHYFPEIKLLNGECLYPSCTHIDEPDCAVKKAVDQGAIHEDRYFSYLKIYQSIEELEEY